MGSDPMPEPYGPIEVRVGVFGRCVVNMVVLLREDFFLPEERKLAHLRC